MAGLTESERSLLAEATADRPELQPLIRRLDAGERLSLTEGNLLRDAVGDEIMRTGIEAGAVNERGIGLDDLIDRIAGASGMWDMSSAEASVGSARVNVFESAEGDWWAECLVCRTWVCTNNPSRREAERTFGRHLQNDPHPAA